AARVRARARRIGVRAAAAAHGLRRLVPDGRPPCPRPPRALQLRRLRSARPPDPAGRTRGRLGRREQEATGSAVPRRARLQAGRLRDEQARADRPAREPGAPLVGLRPPAEGRQARDRPAGGADRRLHAEGARETRPLERARERRERGGRGPQRGREGGFRRSRRRLRLRDGRPFRSIEAAHDLAPRPGAAHGPLRGRDREARAAPRRRARIPPAARRAGRAAGARPLRLRRPVRGFFTAGLVAATAVALTFLALPLVALFVHTSPGRLAAQLGNPVVTDALLVSLKTSAIAHALVLAFGTPAAYLLARRRFPGRALVLALTELPLVLPPAVAGIALLAAFG